MKNKKVFILIILILIMFLLFLIKQEYFVNHKEKLKEFLKSNSYQEEEQNYQKVNGTIEDFYNKKIDNYRYEAFNIENKTYSILNIERVENSIIKNFSAVYNEKIIEFTYTLDKEKGEIQVSGTYNLKTIKYECKNDESICKEAYFKVLDFAKDSIKFYNQKEVYNYKIK